MLQGNWNHHRFKMYVMTKYRLEVKLNKSHSSCFWLYLGIRAFASSAVSGHRFAKDASSNLCSFFCMSRLKTQGKQLKPCTYTQARTHSHAHTHTHTHTQTTTGTLLFLRMSYFKFTSILHCWQRVRQLAVHACLHGRLHVWSHFPRGLKPHTRAGRACKPCMTN